MSGYKGAIWALMLVSACGGNPFTDTTDPVGDTSVSTLPGTEKPRAGASISRYEEKDSSGNGYVKDSDISYDSVNDKFHVNNLAFDGDNSYTRVGFQFDRTPLKPAGVLGDFGVYEAVSQVIDPVTGNPLPNLQYSALRGVSTTGRTQFAIVRSGSFVEYGFGGFVLARNGSVNLPTTGGATYSGTYAAMRDFQGRGGLEYVDGTMTMAIDFEDFDQGAGVIGSISNRQIYDVAGNNITADFLAGLTDSSGLPQTALPVLEFYLGPGTMDKNGEMEGKVNSQIDNDTGGQDVYEDGKYYAILAGDNASEVVGIVVVTSDDPRFDGVTARETGGFVLYRQ
jgi:hypothetical protein